MYHWCTEATMAKVNTACNGSPVLLGCTNHMLICTELLVISISNITFGYRRGCGVQSSCPGDKRCCREETDDCFTPYNQTLLSQLQQTCNGGSSCTLNRDNGLEEISSYCFNGNPRYNSYNKIEYQCVSSAPPSTPQPTTETTPSTTTNTISNTITSKQASTGLTNRQDVGGSNVGGIVGGIVGVIFVIAIVGVVIFFVKRRLKTLKSQNEHHYDSAPRRVSDQPTPVHNSVNTRPQADERTQVSATTSGQTQANHVTQDYEHAYDSAPSVVTDEPKAVYDSLNTREQTGYYNMGNINTDDDNQLSTTNNGRSPINISNQDYEHAYSALDHDTNKPKTVYDSLNTREQTGYYNMGSINTTGNSQQLDRVNEMTQKHT